MSDTVLLGKIILVAEDDRDLREIIADILRLHGARVLEAENGQAALKQFGENEVDLIVSDIRMPNGDGLAFLKGVREATSQSTKPFLFLSGYSDLTPARAIELGAQGLFAKPFDVSDLVAKIADLMPASAPN